MKRTMLVACVAIVSIFTACGKPGALCDADFLADGPNVCPDRQGLGFAQEFNSGTYLGTSVPNSLSVRNGGLADLTISSATLSGDSAFTFMSSPDTFPATIKGNQDLLVTVYFAPTEQRAYEAKLTIVSNAENEPNLVVDISGCGIDPNDTTEDGGTFRCRTSSTDAGTP